MAGEVANLAFKYMGALLHKGAENDRNHVQKKQDLWLSHQNYRGLPWRAAPRYLL
jgi:hypothetical protein